MVKYYTDGSSALAPDNQEGDDSRSYRPSFRVINGGKSNSTNKSNTSDSPSNSSNLRVVDRNNPSHDSREELRDSERNALTNSQPSLYRGHGKSFINNSSNKKNRTQGFLGKRKGFIGILISLGIMIGGGVFLGGTNSLLSSAINDSFTEETDVQYASNITRGRYILKYMLDGEVIQSTWGGAKKYTRMPNSLIKRMNAHGIEVSGSGKNRVLIFKGQTITANDYISTYINNVEFREAINGAKRGRIMGFFDSAANRIANRLGLSRNTQADYQQTNDADADESRYKNIMEESTSDAGNGTLESTHAKEEPEYDENGNPVTNEDGSQKMKEVPEDTDVSARSSSEGGDAAQSSAKSYIDSVAGKVQKISGVVEWSCTAFKLATMISATIAAMDTYSYIRFATPIVEASSKMKTGYGDESAINPVLNWLVTKNRAFIQDFNKITGAGTPSEGSTIQIGETVVEGAPIESDGLSSILTGLVRSNTSGKNFSIERSLLTLGTSVENITDTFQACAIAQLASSTVSSILSIAVTLSTGGLSFLGSYLIRGLVSVVQDAIFSTFLSFLIPVIARSLFTNITEYATGIAGGDILAAGLMAYNSKNAVTGSSLSPSSADQVNQYSKLNNTIIALDAEIDRHNRSPFDITSKNTFLGSIAYKFATTSSTSFIGKIKNLMGYTSSALASITNKVIATDGAAPGDEVAYIEVHGDCPVLNSIDAVGDRYCNLIPTSDQSTLDANLNDNDEYIQTIQEYVKDCDSEGNCQIVNNSDLAKYITFCDGRESPWGYPDANIYNALHYNNPIYSFLGAAPVTEDVASLIEAAQDIKNTDWATGANCVNSPNNPQWDKFKYFQRYIEDQRILTQLGSYEDSQNPVQAYIEQYEAEHPVDNSPTGIIARISGITKADADFIVDVAYYYNFLNNYDPTTRIAMNGTTSDLKSADEITTNLDHEFLYREFKGNFDNYYDIEAIVAEHIIYADIRNRSYAV